ERPSPRALKLITVKFRWSLTSSGIVVALDSDVVTTGFGLEFHPIDDRRVAHKVELLVSEVEENAVDNEIAILVGGHILLRFTWRKVMKRVHTEFGKKPARSAPRYEQIRHVMRLVE